MGTDRLIYYLKKVGWKTFAPGEFLEVGFDQVGKATIDRRDWFLLLKTLSVLDEAALESWNKYHAKFSKKTQTRLFSPGKNYVLILLVDRIDEPVLAQFSWVGLPDFLKMPKDITRGGGFTMMLVDNRHEILIPKPFELPGDWPATEFAKNTYRALDAYMDSLPVFEF